MFVNFNGDWPPQPDPPPRAAPPRIDRKGERRLALVIALNLILVLLAPLAGVTVFDAVIALLGR